jgi:hypothetical protein
MPTQAHLFVGVPVNTPADVQNVFSMYGHTSHINVQNLDYGDIQDLLGQHGLAISVEGKPRAISLVWDDESGVNQWSSGQTNTLTNQRGDSCALLGVTLTSRYYPAILDEGWNGGGRPEPFKLDLDRLQRIVNEVKEQWSNAEILMMDFNH